MSAALNCPHLQPFLEELLQAGASVVRAETAWSNSRVNLVLTKGPTIAAAKARWRLPESVQLWANDDGHYTLENGLSCSNCQVGLSWPREERRVDRDPSEPV
jgi:hypothetical protein